MFCSCKHEPFRCSHAIIKQLNQLHLGVTHDDLNFYVIYNAYVNLLFLVLCTHCGSSGYNGEMKSLCSIIHELHIGKRLRNLNH